MARAGVLLDEDVAVELGEPRLALLGVVEMADGVLDVGLDRGPEEARIGFGEIGRALVAARLRDADLGELVEECIQLARIERVGELADQVGRAYQAGLARGILVVVVLRARESG